MKIMKNILKLTIIASLIVGLFGSCEKDFLDVNDDPNNATEATAGQIFPAATASAAGVIGGNYALAGGIWSQYWTQANASNQYKSFASFNISPDDLDRFAWEELYSGALNDFKAVREKASTDEDWSYFLMSTVLETYTYQILVDLYNRIPYFDALQGADNLNPEFDNGELIYEDLISRINGALAKNLDASSVSNPGAKDFIFNGDMDQWVRFANTLKLKIYLRQRYANQTVAQDGITDMYNNGAEFLETNASMDVFQDADSKSNPFYEMDRRQLNTPNNLRASETMFNWLESNSDPRTEYLYNEAESGGYEAMPQGSHNASNSQIDPDDISVVHLEPTDPVIFMSAAESYFLQAEVAVIYGLGGSAKTLYDNGVMAAFAQYGLDGSSFIASGGEYEFPASGTEEDKLQAIITQKWAAMARFQGMEAWTEWRRTGYPDFFVPPQDNALGQGEFLLRLLFPDSERRANTNYPSLVPVTVPVWWDKD